MYKVNDVVMYRRNVCKVVGLSETGAGGEAIYDLVPYDTQDGSVRMQVPVSNKGGHLRSLITRKEIRDLIKKTPSVQCLDSKPANMKSQYANLLKSDSLQDLICIIKTSYLRNKARADQHKKLASIDDEYLHKAEKYLYDELSVALDMTFDQSKAYFNKEVEKASRS
jgi:RNA polymerase-interacting CarD/CdnL/TRCF family regulator